MIIINIEYNFFSRNHSNILKGLAALMIVIQHISFSYGMRIFTPLGGIGVAIFLICSGYGLHKSFIKNGLDKFIRKRMFRVLLPYWIVTILYNLINYKVFNLTSLFKNILLVRPIPYMWFVQLIIILYCCFYVIYKFIPEKYRILTFIFLGIIFLLSCKNDLWAEQSFSFVLGLYLAQDKTDNKVFKKPLFTSIILLGIGIIMLGLKQFDFIRNSNYIVFNIVQMSMKVSCALGIILFTSCMFKYFFSKFNVIGKASYEIYLIHTLLIFIIQYNIIVYIFVSIICIIGLMYIDNKICGKLK